MGTVCNPAEFNDFFLSHPVVHPKVGEAIVPPAIQVDKTPQEALNTPGDHGPGSPGQGNDTFNLETQIRSAVAAITLSLDTARNIMTNNILPAWGDLGILNSALEVLAGDEPTNALEQLQAFGADVQAVDLAIDTLANLAVDIIGTNSNTQGMANGLAYLKTATTGITDWVKAVGDLSKFNTSGIDIEDRDGSLSALGTVVGSAFSGISKLFPIWGNQPITGWVNSVVGAWKNIINLNDKLGKIVQDATDMILAARALLLAACQAIPALIAMIKKLYDSIYAFFHNLSDFDFNFDIFTGFHFKFPTLPDFLHLKEWEGLRNALDGIGDTFIKCKQALMSTGVPPDPPVNFNAFADAMSSLTLMTDKFKSGSIGIGELTAGVPHALDPVTSLFQSTPSILGVAPNTTTITPEVSGILATLGGGVAASNADINNLVGGACDLRTSNIIQATTDPITHQPTNIAGMPGPQQAIEGTAIVASDLMGLLKGTTLLGSLITGTAAQMIVVGDPNVTEADARAALIAFIDATGQQLAIRQAIFDHNLDPDKMAKAAADYWACRNADDHVSPTPSGPTTLPKDPVNAPAGGDTGTPAAAAVLNGSTGDIVVDPTSGLPTSYMDDSLKFLINSYKNSNTIILDYDSLPLFFVTPTLNALEDYRLLKTLDVTLTKIFNDPKLLSDNLRILTKARQQGIAAGSPYAWLGQGCEVLSGYLDTNGKPMALTALVRDLLVHNPRNLLPLANWLNALSSVDTDVPLPSDLTEDQQIAANASYAYVVENKTADFLATITSMRINADNIGHFMSFEYALTLAVFVLMQRMKDMLTNHSTIEQIALVASEAKKYLQAMTHGDDFIPLLEAIEAGTN